MVVLEQFKCGYKPSLANRGLAMFAGHFIVQAQMAAQDPAVPLSSLRAFSESARNLGPPLFKLAGLAIGNGLTAPVSQVCSFLCTWASAQDRTPDRQCTEFEKH